MHGANRGGRWVAGLLAAACAACASPGPDDVPVAPIDPVVFEGWSGAFLLRNRVAEAVVVPAIGRIAAFVPLGGSNVLHLSAALLGRAPDARAGRRRWANYGGDWLWPLAQARWAELPPGGPSPTALLAGRGWEGRAWIAGDGAQVCLLSRTYGPPLNVRATRLVRLGGITATLDVRQRIEAVGPASLPVAAWSISQVDRPRRIVLPRAADSAWPAGFTPLSFKPPPAYAVRAVGDAVVFRPGLGGDHRVGTDSARGWIAVEQDGWLVIARMRPVPGPGERAPPGVTVAAYGSGSDPYAEIELVGAERRLARGEVLENEVRIACHPLPRTLDDDALVARVELLLGETGGEAAAEAP